jgi:hypothetical protein
MCIHCHKVEAGADVKQVCAIAALAASDWDPMALRTELNDQGIGPILEEVETRMERHHQPQPHIQKLLGPIEISHCEEWLTRAPLRIRQQMIKDSPDNSPKNRVNYMLDHQ